MEKELVNKSAYWISKIQMKGDEKRMKKGTWKKRWWMDFGIGVLFIMMGVLEIGRASCRERVCQYV